MAERKIYRTMQGKTLDFDSIRLQNELVPAVGNMRVNARGDEITPNGQIVKTRDEIVEQKTQKEVEKYTEDFGPEPEEGLSAEEAQLILSQSKKKPEGK
jgi:hypothetical protein